MKQKDQIVLGYVYAAKEAVRLSGLEALKVVGGKTETGKYWLTIDVLNRDRRGDGVVYIRHPVNEPISIRGSRVKSVTTKKYSMRFICEGPQMELIISNHYAYWNSIKVVPDDSKFVVNLCDPDSLPKFAEFVREWWT